VLPRCNTAAMALHLAEISQAVEPGCHAVLLLDQAGWHLSDKLAIPDNITLMPLPPKSPELNPTENIWQFMRDNWLSNRIFRSYEISSTIAATPGTSWSTSLGRSCPSACATGRIGPDQ
jgi:transposase